MAKRVNDSEVEEVVAEEEELELEVATTAELPSAEKPAKRGKKVTCPFCKTEFVQAKFSQKCPQCGVEFETVNLIDMEHKSGHLKSKTIVKEPQHPTVQALHEAENKPLELEQKVGKCISDPNDMPQVYDLGEEIQTNRSGQQRRIHRYRCEFVGLIYRGWVYCPGCWRKLFQNQMMDTGYLSQEYQCKDCYALTSFVFTSGRNVFTYKPG